MAHSDIKKNLRISTTALSLQAFNSGVIGLGLSGNYYFSQSIVQDFQSIFSSNSSLEVTYYSFTAAIKFMMCVASGLVSVIFVNHLHKFSREMKRLGIKNIFHHLKKLFDVTLWRRNTNQPIVTIPEQKKAKIS